MTDMPAHILKACKKCGGRAEIKHTSYFGWAACTNCKYKFGGSSMCYTHAIESIAREWNDEQEKLEIPHKHINHNTFNIAIRELYLIVEEFANGYTGQNLQQKADIVLSKYSGIVAQDNIDIVDPNMSKRKEETIDRMLSANERNGGMPQTYVTLEKHNKSYWEDIYEASKDNDLHEADVAELVGVLEEAAFSLEAFGAQAAKTSEQKKQLMEDMSLILGAISKHGKGE